MIPTPIYLTEEEMLAKWGYPYFGYTVLGVGIWVLSTLPARAKASVLAHEMQHWVDNAFRDRRVWRWEARAWVAGFRASPLGFFHAIWLSVTSPARIKLYVKRILKGF